MDGSLLTIKIAMAILILYDIYLLYRGRNHPKYTLKKIINWAKPLFILVFFSYSIVFLCFVLKLYEDFSSGIFKEESWVSLSAPGMWVIIAFVLFIKVARSINKPIIGYTEEELEWRKQEIEKERAKAPKWLKWLYKKNIKNIV